MAIGFNMEQLDSNSIWDTQLYVVCDANGICYGVFLDEDKANKIADENSAYLSRHKINEKLEGF